MFDTPIIAPGTDPYQARVNAQTVAQAAKYNADLTAKYNAAWDSWNQARGQYTDPTKIPLPPYPDHKWVISTNAQGYYLMTQSDTELVCPVRVPEPLDGAPPTPIVNPNAPPDRLDHVLAVLTSLQARVETLAKLFGL